MRASKSSNREIMMSAVATRTKRRLGSAAASSSTTVEARRNFSARCRPPSTTISRAAVVTRCRLLLTSSAFAASGNGRFAGGGLSIGALDETASLTRTPSGVAACGCAGALVVGTLSSTAASVLAVEVIGSAFVFTSIALCCRVSGTESGTLAGAAAASPCSVETPHCGQKAERTRIAAPHDLHRRAISISSVNSEK
jgi:hypothetical protein